MLNLEKMQGEGLKHVDVMQARVVTLDADDDLIALLEGVQVDLKDEIDMTQFKGLLTNSWKLCRTCPRTTPLGVVRGRLAEGRRGGR